MIGYLTLIVALAANIDVTEDIATSTTWTADNTYNLTKQIYVLPGATFTIEAGTIIASEASANGAGGLCVTNGRTNLCERRATRTSRDDIFA